VVVKNIRVYNPKEQTMRVISSPQIRFEHRYSGRLTVLEGAELSELLESFFKQFEKEPKKTKDFSERLFEAVLQSYVSVHGKEVTYQAACMLKKKSNPYRDADARKLDLFYRGMLQLMKDVFYPRGKPKTASKDKKTH
jgi:hypothetical protein